MSTKRTEFFIDLTVSRLGWLVLGWTGLLGLIHLVIRWIGPLLGLIVGAYWPINVMMAKLPVWQDGVSLLALTLLSYLLWKSWDTVKQPFSWFALTISLMWVVNLLNGWHDGLVSPVVGRDRFSVSYWQDTDRFQTVERLLSTYTAFQPNLMDHSRVHPPGALLWYMVLRWMTDSALMTSMVTSGMGILSGVLLYAWLKERLETKLAKQWTVFYLLIPASQIYLISSLDGVIATGFVATAWFFDRLVRGGQPKFIWLTCLSLFITLMLTYAGLLLPFFLVSFEWLTKGEVKQSLKIVGLVLAGLMGLLVLTGFSYQESFVIATSFEGPGGSAPTTHLATYLVSRLQDILELVIFLGPVLTVWLGLALKAKGIPWIKELWMKLTGMRVKQAEVNPLVSAGMLLLLGFLSFIALGAYYTGETARAAFYVYPFIFVLLAVWSHRQTISEKAFRLTALSLITQTALMQLFFWFAW